MEAVLLEIGDAHVELLTPIQPDSGVAKFLERNGPGMHHVAYRTDDIDAALERLRAARAAADRRAAAHRHPRAAAWRSCTPSPPAGCSPRSCNRRKEPLMATSDRMDVGFQGGQVLAVRAPQRRLRRAREGARRRQGQALAHARDRRLGDPRRPLAGRLRPARAAATRRSASSRRSVLRARWTWRCCACCGPAATRPRPSGRCWPSPAPASTACSGSLVAVAGAVARPAPRAPLYLRAVRVVVLAYLTNIAMKYVVRRAPAAAGGAARRCRRRSPACPTRRRTPPRRSPPRAALSRRAARARRCTPAPARWRCRASTWACTTRPTSRPAPLLGTAMAELIP